MNPRLCQTTPEGAFIQVGVQPKPLKIVLLNRTNYSCLQSKLVTERPRSSVLILQTDMAQRMGIYQGHFKATISTVLRRPLLSSKVEENQKVKLSAAAVARAGLSTQNGP